MEIDGIRLVGGSVTVAFRDEPMKGAAAANTGNMTLRVGRLRVPMLGFEAWYGNWCWDRARVLPVYARDVLNYLAVNPKWHCEDAPDWIDEAVEQNRKITPQEWMRVLQEAR